MEMMTLHRLRSLVAVMPLSHANAMHWHSHCHTSTCCCHMWFLVCALMCAAKPMMMGLAAHIRAQTGNHMSCCAPPYPVLHLHDSLLLFYRDPCWLFHSPPTSIINTTTIATSGATAIATNCDAVGQASRAPFRVFAYIAQN